MKNLKICYSNKRNQDDFDKLIYIFIIPSWAINVLNKSEISLKIGSLVKLMNFLPSLN